MDVSGYLPTIEEEPVDNLDNKEEECTAHSTPTISIVNNTPKVRCTNDLSSHSKSSPIISSNVEQNQYGDPRKFVRKLNRVGKSLTMGLDKARPKDFLKQRIGGTYTLPESRLSSEMAAILLPSFDEKRNSDQRHIC